MFLIIKENRTYDQVFGDISRGDGDPALTLFGANITPNEHGLVQRFPLLDHVYADSQVSIDSNYITSSGASRLRRAKRPPNYAGRGRPLDFGAYEVAAPYEGKIFDRALDQGISFYNYGEAFAGLVPPSFFPDKDRTAAEAAQNEQVLAGSDVQLFGAVRRTQVGRVWRRATTARTRSSTHSSRRTRMSSTPRCRRCPAGAHSRYDCWLARFQQQLAHNTVPTLNYMVLPLDHTEGVAPGTARRTPTSPTTTGRSARSSTRSRTPRSGTAR